MFAGTLRIVTLNTWKNEGDYLARLEAMEAGLRAVAADVILLQEVFRIVDERSDACRGADTARSLAEALGFSLAYAPARRKLRLWGGRNVWSESGLAILVRGESRWTERLPLPGDERGGERIALLAEVEVRGVRCLAACVHLSHLRGDDERRREQLETVLAHPRWGAAGGVIGGDFNCTVASPALQSFAVHAGLQIRNVFGAAGGPATHPLPPRPERDGRAIDHLLVVEPWLRHRVQIRGASRALDAPVDGVWPSDHAALYTDVVLAPPGAPVVGSELARDSKAIASKLASHDSLSSYARP